MAGSQLSDDIIRGLFSVLHFFGLIFSRFFHLAEEDHGQLQTCMVLSQEGDKAPLSQVHVFCLMEGVLLDLHGVWGTIIGQTWLACSLDQSGSLLNSGTNSLH